ncbi:hypothetical protein CONPUDRAFT_75542 [Coniophora puteana RWD-64-598 SS2]|uniref:Uncharacterized protein n=1 Tax=Coniophora puteana (strain RWD-64-598) TaxID=741705 RepID=A0A5M3MET7_CONPW|nr:uncharacterized protein CONPUDRAFT_75542 [Coniophora puteana RWD-64-598 SS2]EIW77738.1 hypothetical protein CONPUDRAFT_75542 [Coniophora puteana RWD-64-598 SS2]
MFDHNKHASRKYIDLIHRASSEWANWKPSIRIKVGSFGTVDKKTGELLVEGNIYDECNIPLLAALCPGFDLANHKPVETESKGYMEICSAEVKQLELSLDGSCELPLALSEASIKKEWHFPQRQSSALLVVYAPCHRHMPPDALRVLANLCTFPAFKDRCLVTSVTSCPAYSLHLCDKSGGKVKVELGSKVLIPHSPVSAGGNCGFKWNTITQTSLSREEAHPEGHSIYDPLFTLKRFPKRNFLTRSHSPSSLHMGAFFVSPDVSPISPASSTSSTSLTSSYSDSETDVEIEWDNAKEPWLELDDDGEELPSEDLQPVDHQRLGPLLRIQTADI